LFHLSPGEGEFAGLRGAVSSLRRRHSHYGGRGARRDAPALGGADDVCLAFDYLQDLRCRRELAHIHLGEVTEGCECLAGLTASGAVNLAGIAADTLKLRLHRNDDLFRLESRRGRGRRSAGTAALAGGGDGAFGAGPRGRAVGCRMLMHRHVMPGRRPGHPEGKTPGASGCRLPDQARQ